MSDEKTPRMRNDKQIPRLPIKTFRERGYLHEINRLVLHPLGLALEVVVDERTGEQRLGGVWDYQDDPEGLIFGDDLLSKEKAATVCEELLGRREARLAKLGYVVQPIADARVLTINYLDPDKIKVTPDMELEQ